MPFPPYVLTRTVTVGGAAILESADLMRIRLTVTASRSLIHADTGYRFKNQQAVNVSELGTDAVLALPRTDLPGWKNAVTGDIIDVSAEGSYTHQYIALVEYLDTDGNSKGISPDQIGPFVLPAGDGAVDLDKIVPVGSSSGEAVSIPAWFAEIAAQAQAAADEARAAVLDSTEFVRKQVAEPGPVRQELTATIDAAVPPVVAATIADAPEIVTAAAELAQSDAGLMRVEMVDATSEGNRLDMSFPDRPKFMTLVELADDSPYLTYVKYSTGEFHSYEKKNGEVYPPRTTPVTPATPAPFYIVGDSVAEAWTTNTADLTSATGRAVAVEGIGGQPSPPIAARQGGVPARVTVDGDVIPATGTVSVTAITEADGTALSPLHLTANGSRTREVAINGARCTLASTTASGVTTYTLAQINGTTAMPCPAGTPMVPPARAASTVTVLLGPRNDLGPSVGDAFRQPLEKILARYKAMIERAKLNGGRVILLPVVPRTDATAEGRANLVTLNNALRDLAPQDWADWLAWLKSDAAFTAAGVTKTTDDASDIANGDTPRSFRSDTLHLNAAGYRAANRFISLVSSARGL